MNPWTAVSLRAIAMGGPSKPPRCPERFTSKYKQLWRATKSNLIHVPLTMWIGSAYMVLARFNSLYIGKARRFLRTFRRVAASGNPDGIVYTKMLEAEYAVLTSTPTVVRDAF